MKPKKHNQEFGDLIPSSGVKRSFKKTMFIIRYRWWIISLTLLCVALSIIPLFNIRINSDLESYLPDTMQSKQSSKLISDVFGNEEPVLIILESADILHPATLQRIENLSNAFSKQQEFKRVYTLFDTKNIRSEDGAMIIEPVIGKIPHTNSEIEKLRNEIKANDLAYKLVVSADFRYTLLILSSDKTLNDSELMTKIQQTLDQFPGAEKVSITGQPYLRDDANKKISRDLLVLLPLGLLIMFLVLWVSFRELKGVLLPFSVVVFSIIVCMGLIPAFGWELSLIGVLIPIMMIAIANNYGVYFIARYQDLNANEPELSMKKIVQLCVSYLVTPVTLCGLTTIVGILGLVAHLLLPARQMGIVTGIGISFALIVSLLFIPSMLSLMKKGKPHKDLTGHSKGIISILLHRTGTFVTVHPKSVIILFAVFFLLTSSGLIFFRVAPDSNRVLPKNHSFNRAISIADEHFGGSKMISVMYTGDAKSPELLNKMNYCEMELKKMPQIGSVTSLATIIRKMSTALNDSSSAEFDKIPQSGDAVAQYIELYSMNADADDIEQFVNFDYTKTLMTIQYRAKKLSEINQILEKLKTINGNDQTNITVGGYSLVEKEISESIVNGQIYSLILALIAIIILLSLIFKSVNAGIIGSLPLVFAVFCTFGLMGWLGIELNMVTALLSSISIGLGVDFTIHIFWRIKWELSRGNNYAGSIISTLKTIGRGISINALSVMLGFSVLFFSLFPLIQSFAFLIIISLFLCLMSALILIPALCIRFKPKFLEK
ncbi:MAG TPA: MMPL family transporter [Paludibacter sp.]|nr:MMPL family transporter [Paludibacter sp.]